MSLAMGMSDFEPQASMGVAATIWECPPWALRASVNHLALRVASCQRQWLPEPYGKANLLYFRRVRGPIPTVDESPTPPSSGPGA